MKITKVESNFFSYLNKRMSFRRAKLPFTIVFPESKLN